MTVNDRRDANVDRCPGCGGWRWRQRCATCEPRPGFTWQDGMPPYTIWCGGCGEHWEPAPARGKTHPTDSSIQREIDRHWKACPARNYTKEEA